MLDLALPLFLLFSFLIDFLVYIVIIDKIPTVIGVELVFRVYFSQMIERRNGVARLLKVLWHL